MDLSYCKRDVVGAIPLSNFCAKEDTGRICSGDSGSFLGRRRPGQEDVWEVIGVTSYTSSYTRCYGNVCRVEDECEGPAGFARANFYKGWIEKYM